ncbi:hypothetical protein QR680_014835 [Steinernema hermaphroditum]|uniref:C2H2-type domain-containing protein n=1 Tax=Steinernema hermaphroditum TaxID=289476 RepID=A0AA39ICU6_9BILA|nr:hypothetical protein QR680_014835 [Steinernema hermaphroditum]
MTGMDPGPSGYDYLPEDGPDCDYDSVDYWFQTDVPYEQEDVQPQPETYVYEDPEEVTYTECVMIDNDSRGDSMMLVPCGETQGMMHEAVILERLRDRPDCNLERCECLVQNCGRYFESYTQLAFHLSYSHREATETGMTECLVCGAELKARGRIMHLTTKHRALAAEHHRVCQQQRQDSAWPLRRRRVFPKRPKPQLFFQHQPQASAIVHNAPSTSHDVVYVVEDEPAPPPKKVYIPPEPDAMPPILDDECPPEGFRPPAYVYDPPISVEELVDAEIPKYIYR